MIDAKFMICGNGVIEIETPKVRNKPYRNTTRKINKNIMVNEDGEIIEIKHSNNRAFNKSAMRKTLKYIYRLILTNFTGAESEQLIVLTYADDVTELKTCYDEFESFYEKLKRRLKKKLDYIIVNLYTKEKRPYYELWVKTKDNSPLIIDNKMLQSIWTNGMAFTCKITDVRFQANYIEYSYNLEYYPPYTKLFRKSTGGGIKDVEPKTMYYAEAQVLVKEMKQTYATTKLVNKKSKMGLIYAVNKISYESYLSKQYIKNEVKTMAEYIEENQKRKQEILQKISNESNYKDVGAWLKLDWVSRDLQNFLVKLNVMLEYDASSEAIQEYANDNLGNTLANISWNASNFNLFETSSLRGIQLLLDSTNHLKEYFEQVQWSENDKTKLSNMFDYIVSTMKSTDIYVASQNTKNIEED